MFRLTTNLIRMNTPEAISARLTATVAAAIRTAGLTQRAVSERTGIPLVTLSRRLTGRTAFNMVELAAIAEVLDLSVVELAVRAERLRDAA